MTDPSDQDDPRFSMHPTIGEIDLPVTAVFMNAVELLAQYAELDYSGRIPGRHGIVLPEFPQVEIAVLPAAPARSVPVRWIIWAIYDMTIEMAELNEFKETEVVIRWEDQAAAYVYFTKPLDISAGTSSNTQSISPLVSENTTNTHGNSSLTTIRYSANTGSFSWRPIYKPNAQNISPKDVFIVAMSVLRSVAKNPGTEKVPGAFRISSPFINANIQFYLQDRISPRRRPPFFQYTHIREAVRRIPGWMLAQRRFAEFYCSIVVSTIPVGQVVIAHGPFIPQPSAVGDGISIS